MRQHAAERATADARRVLETYHKNQEIGTWSARNQHPVTIATSSPVGEPLNSSGYQLHHERTNSRRRWQANAEIAWTLAWHKPQRRIRPPLLVHHSNHQRSYLACHKPCRPELWRSSLRVLAPSLGNPKSAEHWSLCVTWELSMSPSSPLR